MRLVEKITILSVMLGLGILPAFARIEGKISKNHFYDTDKTIMIEETPDQTLKTGKYWSTNLFYFSKYRPLFMLSNKELYNLMPRENVSIVQRITTPSIYNISLKAASIKPISFNALPPANLPIAVKKNNSAPKPQVVPEKVTIKEFTAKEVNSDIRLISQYEQSKNPETESEQKIETALLLKASKKISNYKLAIDLLDDVTRYEPYNAYAFYLKGDLYAEQQDNENAMKNYIEALRLNPTSKQPCLGIAKMLEPTNKELAQKYYDLAK